MVLASYMIPPVDDNNMITSFYMCLLAVTLLLLSSICHSFASSLRLDCVSNRSKNRIACRRVSLGWTISRTRQGLNGSGDWKTPGSGRGWYIWFTSARAECSLGKLILVQLCKPPCSVWPQRPLIRSLVGTVRRNEFTRTLPLTMKANLCWLFIQQFFRLPIQVGAEVVIAGRVAIRLCRSNKTSTRVVHHPRSTALNFTVLLLLFRRLLF